MSQVITFAKPAASAIRAPAMTPAAGPESVVRTGRERAVSTDITPPLDCTISNSASIPRVENPASTPSRYAPKIGCRQTLSAVVDARSNSRISGRISEEALT